MSTTRARIVSVSLSLALIILLPALTVLPTRVAGRVGSTANPTNPAVDNPVPTLSSISPTIKAVGDTAFTLTVTGANFNSSSIIRFNGSDRSTTFVNGTQLTAQITATDVALPGTFPITVFNPAPGGGVSNAIYLTVIIEEPFPVLSSISPASKVAGDAAFTLTVNGAAFAGNAVVRWNVQDRTTTFVSSTQLTAQITAADIATAGTANVNVLNPLPGGGYSNALTFTITSASGYEGDVAPRPSGSGTVSIADWVQTGRFAAGLDTAVAGSEFQAADCAPRDTLGDGIISIADWVQAGRYASGLDPVTAAGGPTGPTGSSSPSTAQIEIDSFRTDGASEAESAEASTVKLVRTILPAGQSSAVSIEFDAQGNENAFGFSLMFDPAKLKFVSAEKSIKAGTLNVNGLAAAKGRIGIGLALPVGSTFPRGRHQVVVITFSLRSDSSELPAITFADLPIAREVVDLNANRLNAVFHNGSEANPLEAAQFFVNQPYLDFLRLGRL